MYQADTESVHTQNTQLCPFKCLCVFRLEVCVCGLLTETAEHEGFSEQHWEPSSAGYFEACFKKKENSKRLFQHISKILLS